MLLFGFTDGNTDEELCNRWMQLAAFTPFYRNHNEKGALSQEPYRWESVANASRTAIAVRYSLLPYWVGRSIVRMLRDFKYTDTCVVHIVCKFVDGWHPSRAGAVL